MIDWSDLLVGIGIAATVEGALYALLPDTTRRAMTEFFALPTDTRRMIALATCALGVTIVWIARG